MINSRQPMDVPQTLLSVLFLSVMIVACLWIVQPFILGFAWAGTVVIATWPVLIRLQRLLWGRRSLAVLVMTLLLILLFIIPIALLVNSLVDNSGPLINWISKGQTGMPELNWLNSIPLVGAKLYSGWHNLLESGGSAIMAKVRPYIGTTTTWFIGPVLLAVSWRLFSVWVQEAPAPQASAGEALDAMEQKSEPLNK